MTPQPPRDFHELLEIAERLAKQYEHTIDTSIDEPESLNGVQPDDTWDVGQLETSAREHHIRQGIAVTLIRVLTLLLTIVFVGTFALVATGAFDPDDAIWIFGFVAVPLISGLLLVTCHYFKNK